MYCINCFAKNSFFYVLAKYIISNFVYQKYYLEFINKSILLTIWTPNAITVLKSFLFRHLPFYSRPNLANINENAKQVKDVETYRADSQL